MRGASAGAVSHTLAVGRGAALGGGGRGKRGRRPCR